MKINTVLTGIPQKEATDLLIRVMPFETDATTCGLYWWITDAEGAQLTEGNIYLTEQEFTDWGFQNVYLEDLVLAQLNLTRKTE